MEDEELRKAIQKNVKEKIAISTIREEINMNKIKNKKIFYGILSTAAMFVLGIVVISNNRLDLVKKDNKDIIAEQNEKQSGIGDLNTENIELNINDLGEIGLAKFDADVEIIKMENIMDEFDFIKNIKIPKEYELESSYNIYIKSNPDIKKYDKLHDYVLAYRKDIEENITIAFSKVGEPLRDYQISEKDEISTIGNVEMRVYKAQDMYVAFFKYKEMYFDIETEGITESELLELLESIITEKMN